jgi:hypothetical protein
MNEKVKKPIRIDLNQFKLHIGLKNRVELTLHFDSPSRRFYLSLIAFVVNEMKKLGKIASIPPYIIMAACYILSGRMEEARAAAAEVIRLNPKFSLEQFPRIKTQPCGSVLLNPYVRQG